MGDVKDFLIKLCQKQKWSVPEFDFRPTGPKHRLRFLCELRVSDFPYVGAGLCNRLHSSIYVKFVFAFKLDVVSKGNVLIPVMVQ